MRQQRWGEKGDPVAGRSELWRAEGRIERPGVPTHLRTPGKKYSLI